VSHHSALGSRRALPCSHGLILPQPWATAEPSDDPQGREVTSRLPDFVRFTLTADDAGGERRLWSRMTTPEVPICTSPTVRKIVIVYRFSARAFCAEEGLKGSAYAVARTVDRYG
jgi:hypothetical protein